MTRRRSAAVAVSALLAGLAAASPVLASGTQAVAASPAVHPVPGTHCPRFPADDVWHADVSKLPVAHQSRTWLAHMGSASTRLHPDFGPSFGAQPVPYGIPVTVVKAGHPKVTVTFEYAGESDKGPYPLGSDTRIEGGAGSGGDRHAVVVDASTCRLYETWDTLHTAHGWTAGSGAVWSLTSDRLRPAGWTSADAAGLPILPGLLSWDEVRSGSVDHAIRFTTDVTSRRYVWPARHQAGSTSSTAYPPMGARFRLAASYNPKGALPATRVVLAAMKKYGLILADNGSPWFFQGVADSRWPNAVLDQLKRIPARDFVAVDESSLEVSPSSGAVKPQR